MNEFEREREVREAEHQSGIPSPEPDTVATAIVTAEFKEYCTTSLSLSYDTHRKRYIFACGYDSRHIPKDHGFWWDGKEKEWYTEDPFTAMKLIHYADPVCREKLVRYWNLSTDSFQASQLASNDLREAHEPIYIPCPAGKDYKPYQRVGIEFIVRPDPRCQNTLLGDDMGLGKTVQIIGAINYLSDALSNRKLSNVLIVCPNSLKLVWGRHLRDWLVGNLTWGIAESKFFPRNRDITIINYDILDKYAEYLHSKSWELLIADEAHYLKNPLAKRSKAFYAIPAARRVYATGTPIVNRPRELFPLVHSLDVEQFPKFLPFGIRYCNGNKNSGSWDFSGASNLEELQARLRATIMLRRLKAGVLTELPPKTRNIIELPTPRSLSKLVERELATYNEREPMREALKQRVEDAKRANDTTLYQQSVSELKKFTGDILGSIAALRKAVALEKVPLVTTYLEDLWKEDPDRKIVLWCHHHDVMDSFMQKFGNFNTRGEGATKEAAFSVKFSGNESLKERDEAIQHFQNNPRCLLFIGQIQAGGVGITLTASSHCIFAELDWVPGNISQAEDRLHRIGQHDNVLVEHLVLENSLDCRIAQKVVSKQQVIDEAMNNPTNHLNQHSMMIGG